MSDEDDYPASLEEAVVAEQVQLWGDLEAAVRDAHRGGWPVQCENLEYRIISLARLAGTTPWGEVGVSLLRSGVYERILTEAGLPYESIDWERVAEVEAMIAR